MKISNKNKIRNTKPLKRKNNLYLIKRDLASNDEFEDKDLYHEEMISDEYQGSSSSRAKIKLPVSTPCSSINKLNRGLEETKINKIQSVQESSKSSSVGSFFEIKQERRDNYSYYSSPQYFVRSPKITSVSIKNIKGERHSEFK